jgi:hypothetical protein
MKQLHLLEATSTPRPTLLQPDLMDDDSTYQETESDLEAHLENELAHFTPLNLKPVADSTLHSKFAFSSAMQKCLRRGHVEDSIRYATAYHSLDPTGFWTRLVVVAFEDVGLGGVVELALTLAVARSKIFRQKIGGDEKVISFIVSKLAKSIKSRSCGDFMQVLWYHPRKFKDMTALRTATTEELTAFALSERNSTSFRSSAGWLLAGTDKYECKTLPLRSGSREQFCTMVSQLKIPALVKYVTMRGMVACRFPMPAVYPFLWQMKEKSIYINVETSCFPEERHYISGLPDFTFDQYVRQGKQSFGYFAIDCQPVTQFLTAMGLTSTDARIKAIGASVFVVEGALLDRRLQFDGVEDIYQMAEQYDYENAGLDLEGGSTLSKLILENYLILRQSRQRAVGV